MVRAHGRLSPPYLCVKPAPSKAIPLRGVNTNTKNLFTVMAFKEVYDDEILISEIGRSRALYDCSLREYSDKGLKERLWGEVCEGKDGKFWVL